MRPSSVQSQLQLNVHLAKSDCHCTEIAANTVCRPLHFIILTGSKHNNAAVTETAQTNKVEDVKPAAFAFKTARLLEQQSPE